VLRRFCPRNDPTGYGEIDITVCLYVNMWVNPKQTLRKRVGFQA